MARIDITVRGAGIFGLSVAWACVMRGASVRVVDPFGAGAGSSGGIVGALAPHVPENWNDKKEFQLESLLMAEGFWAAVEAAGGVSSGYGRTGRLQPVADDAAEGLARARGENAKSLWKGRAEWGVKQADAAGAFRPATPSGLLIHDTLTARMHPRRACAALVAALQAKGCEVVTDAPDEGQVVWATGWQGLLDLNTWVGKNVGAGIKGQAVLFDYAAPDAPQLFVDGLHIVPHADGTVAIGSTSEREFDSPTATDDQCDTLINRAIAALPELDDAPVIERWAGVRPRAKSRAPMLGAWPDRDGHFIVNGGFKIGFGMAPKVSEVMADLLLEGRDTIPESFRVAASI